jgi:hypothetical protein
MDIGRWLHAIFTPQAAYGQTPASAPARPVAPVSRAGNTYMGAALPAGTSSLLASSQDRTARPAGERRGDKRKAAKFGNQQGQMAGALSAMLFGEGAAAQAENPNLRLPSDKWVDRLFDRAGMFDPNAGWSDQDLYDYTRQKFWDKARKMNPR